MFRRNRYLSLIGAVLLAVAGFGSTGNALAVPMTFMFSGSAGPDMDPTGTGTGTGSATMTIDGFGTNTMTVVVDNTSSIDLDTPTAGEGNAPALLTFGFDLTDVDLTNIVSSSLIARDLVTPRTNPDTFTNIDLLAGPSPLWVIASSAQSNISLDMLADNGQGVQRALYNPDCIGDTDCEAELAATPNFFTTATLTITFNQAWDADFHSATGNDTPSPFVRFQNVGLNGEGSLKLAGTQQVPEPGTLFLLGIGLVGFTIGQRRLKSLS